MANTLANPVLGEAGAEATPAVRSNLAFEGAAAGQHRGSTSATRTALNTLVAN